MNQRMLQGLAKHGPSSLIGPVGCADFAPSMTSVEQVPASPVARFMLGALLVALRAGYRRRPRIALAGSGLTAPLAWMVARIFGSRCAVYLHGLDVIAPSRLYQWCWLPFIRRSDIVIVNSRNTASLAIERGVAANRIHVIHPGTDIPAPDSEARQNFRARHGLGAEPLLISVGRLTMRKGLAEFVRDVFPAVLAKHPRAILLIIGADATDAVGAARHSESSRIIESARRAGVEHALRLTPHCDDETLSSAYRAADVHVFPVRDVPGDVEGFGMVAIEAAAHGLPTVAYAVGGVEDAVVEGVTGSLCAGRDAAGFAAAAMRWIEAPLEARSRCEARAVQFSWAQFDDALHAALLQGD